MKLLDSAKKYDQNKDGEQVNNNYQQASKVLFAFVPKKQFGQLVTIARH